MQIHTPLGMRDLIKDEVQKKEALKNRIESVFSAYGYQEVIAPTIEFLESYQKAFSNLQVEQMYKFFDAQSQILALRMDMTVPIARICASKYKDALPPYRFRYCSNVFKVRESFAGRRSEVTDCGVELIGLDDQSDLEVITCALDTMAAFGMDHYTLEIGNSSFFKVACQCARIPEEKREELAYKIDQKSLVDLQALLHAMKLDPKVCAFFAKLPLLNGGAEVLEEALRISFDPQLQSIVQSLQDLYQNLQQLGYKDHISFDFGKVPHLDYYTGILFEGFVEGVGVSVLSGGRYDSLLEKFGRDLPACGFSVKLDYLLESLKTPSKKILRLYYPQNKQLEAYQKAQILRQEHEVSLIPCQAQEIRIEEDSL